MCANHEGLINAIKRIDSSRVGTRTNSAVAVTNHTKAIKEARSGDYTYGHYTFASVNKIVAAMMNPSELFKQQPELNASHMLGVGSVFLDIGSGFGYPNLVATARVGCGGLGIEISSNRVRSC